jgi:hypothetical protein
MRVLNGYPYQFGIYLVVKKLSIKTNFTLDTCIGCRLTAARTSTLLKNHITSKYIAQAEITHLELIVLFRFEWRTAYTTCFFNKYSRDVPM